MWNKNYIKLILWSCWITPCKTYLFICCQQSPNVANEGGQEHTAALRVLEELTVNYLIHGHQLLLGYPLWVQVVDHCHQNLTFMERKPSITKYKLGPSFCFLQYVSLLISSMIQLLSFIEVIIAFTGWCGYYNCYRNKR